MKEFLYCIFCLASLLLTSCTSEEYYNVIPYASKAIISIETSSLDKAKPMQDIVSTILPVVLTEDNGIDPAERIFLFETADGSYGLCAKIASNGDLEDALLKVSTRCKKGPERSDLTFYYVDDKWVLGTDGNSLLALGPVLTANRGDAIQQMVNAFKQDAKGGFAKSKLMKTIAADSSGIRLLTQLDALPQSDMVSALFSYGSPKGAQMCDVLLDAELSYSDSVMHIDGNLTSFAPDIKESINNTYSRMNPIANKYANVMDASQMFTLIANADGSDILQTMKDNKSLGAFLLGSDFDAHKDLPTLNGEMFLQCNPVDDKQTMSFFGKKKDGSDYSHNLATGVVPFGSQVLKMTEGKKLAVIVNLSSAGKGNDELLATLSSLLGGVKTIVYSIK